MNRQAVYRAGLASLALVLALANTGCTSIRPLPLKEPVAPSAGVDESGKEIPPLKYLGLGPARNRSQAIDHTEKYADAYLEAADGLHRANFNASDTTFAGGVLGMVGALAKSPETALVGATMGGFSGVVSQRYAFQIQASNYEGAARAMLCLRNVLWANAHYGQVHYVNQRIEDIRGKLRVNQAKIDLATPDLGTLQASIKMHGDTMRGEQEAREELARVTFEEDQENITRAGLSAEQLKAHGLGSTNSWTIQRMRATYALQVAKDKETEAALLTCSSSY